MVYCSHFNVMMEIARMATAALPHAAYSRAIGVIKAHPIAKAIALIKEL